MEMDTKDKQLRKAFLDYCSNPVAVSYLVNTIKSREEIMLAKLTDNPFASDESLRSIICQLKAYKELRETIEDGANTRQT